MSGFGMMSYKSKRGNGLGFNFSIYEGEFKDDKRNVLVEVTLV